MLCYKDMTFCPYWEECNLGYQCDRALTQLIKDNAEKWMKNAPISQFSEKPSCFYPHSKSVAKRLKIQRR